ncbi:MAG TPA: HK97 family phage prohead protease [Terriglobia bacterium]|nr:HK97 family phage prohead protease [Terriglobia bacterium]
MKREIRIFPGSEVRAIGDSNIIKGYASVFGQPSEDLGGFTEYVQKGAFARTLADPRSDVRCLFNHDSSCILGRSAAGTLRLMEDDHGLEFECDLPDTQMGRDLRVSIARGDISQCSFGFTVMKQEWDESGDVVKRTLTDVDLFDVSPVTYPAYPSTSVDVRNLWPDGAPGEVLNRLLCRDANQFEYDQDTIVRMRDFARVLSRM